MTECEYYKSYCEIIQKGEEGYKKQSASIKVMFDEMLKDIKDDGFPHNNKYYWVGLMLGINAKEE